MRKQLDERDDCVIVSVKKDAALYQGRWQRVLKAYLSLRDVKSLRDDEVHTPALAKYLALHESLVNGDQQVLP